MVSNELNEAILNLSHELLKLSVDLLKKSLTVDDDAEMNKSEGKKETAAAADDDDEMNKKEGKKETADNSCPLWHRCMSCNRLSRCEDIVFIGASSSDSDSSSSSDEEAEEERWKNKREEKKKEEEEETKQRTHLRWGPWETSEEDRRPAGGGPMRLFR